MSHCWSQSRVASPHLAPQGALSDSKGHIFNGSDHHVGTKLITGDKMLSWTSDSAQQMTVINQSNCTLALKWLIKAACRNDKKKEYRLSWGNASHLFFWGNPDKWTLISHSDCKGGRARMCMYTVTVCVCVCLLRPSGRSACLCSRSKPLSGCN